MLLQVSIYAGSMNNKFASTLQECINIDANYNSLESLAKALNWKELPEDFNKAIKAESVKDVKSFLIEVSKDKKSFIILIIQKPDMCTVSYSSNKSNEVLKMEKIVIDSFKFNKLSEEKAGLQTKVFYSINKEGKSKIISNKYIFNNQNTYSISVSSTNAIRDKKEFKKNEEFKEIKKEYFKCTNRELLINLMKFNNSITSVHIWDRRFNKNTYIKKNIMSYVYYNKLDNDYSLTFNNNTLKLYNLSTHRATLKCNEIEKTEYENFGM